MKPYTLKTARASVRVRFNADAGEIVCSLTVAGKAREAADYFTSCPDDARATAADMLARADAAERQAAADAARYGADTRPVRLAAIMADPTADGSARRIAARELAEYTRRELIGAVVAADTPSALSGAPSVQSGPLYFVDVHGRGQAYGPFADARIACEYMAEIGIVDPVPLTAEPIPGARAPSPEFLAMVGAPPSAQSDA